MTPTWDTCQLDFRPGEEADMETWEREGVARCRGCAAEFAALQRLAGEVVDFLGSLLPLDFIGFCRAIDDSVASRGVVTDARQFRVGEFGNGRFISGPVQLGNGYLPGGVTILSRSRPHG